MGELDKRPRAGGRAVLSRTVRKLGGRRDGGNAWTCKAMQAVVRFWCLPSNRDLWAGVTEKGR